MADTALDTQANPYDQYDQYLQTLQPPAQSEPTPAPVVQGDQPQIAQQQAPAPPPAPLAPPPRALDPQATPTQEVAPPPLARQAPPPPPGGLTFVERPDKEDFEDYKKARDAEKQTWKDNLLTHDTHRPVTPPNLVTDVKQIPRWQELEAIRDLYQGMTPKERKEMEAQIVREQNRMITETNRKNDQARKDYAITHRTELAKLDAPRETPEARQKTIDLVEQQRQAIEAEYKKLQTSGKPEDKNKGNYTLTVTPLGTMKAPEFSEAAAQIATYNPISARQAAIYTSILGEPVNRDPKTGELKPGANGVTGRGATAYTVVGRDGKDHIKVRMPDNEIIRVPLKVFNQMADVRDVGYLKQREYWAKRRTDFEAAAKDDWVTRQAKRAVGAIQERLQ